MARNAIKLAQCVRHRCGLLFYSSTMERARATWTDQRLDDMARRIDDGFNRVDQDLRALRAETKNEIGALRVEMKNEIGAQRSEMKNEIGAQRSETRDEIGTLRGEMSAGFGALNRTMLQLGGGMIVTFVVGFAGILVARLA
jgi:hypothetical protein